jgi:hypothetical protein
MFIPVVRELQGLFCFEFNQLFEGHLVQLLQMSMVVMRFVMLMVLVVPAVF